MIRRNRKPHPLSIKIKNILTTASITVLVIAWIVSMVYAYATFDERCIEDIKQRGLIFDNLNCLPFMGEEDIQELERYFQNLQ